MNELSAPKPSPPVSLLYRVTDLKQKCRELADACYDANIVTAQCRADAAAHELHKAIGCIEEIEREARYND